MTAAPSAVANSKGATTTPRRAGDADRGEGEATIAPVFMHLPCKVAEMAFWLARPE
jgi:hypothetical protein